MTRSSIYEVKIKGSCLQKGIVCDNKKRSMYVIFSSLREKGVVHCCPNFVRWTNGAKFD